MLDPLGDAVMTHPGKSNKTFCATQDSQLGAITPAERGVNPD